ncbi:MAG: class I SAM-dependent RNA methyltransferase [Eubacterium sp.]|nr:class I SAM-dependent RNA methyltransferase [Eubacterium sp.]
MTEERFELIAPCHFGLESVLKKEIMNLGYDIVQVEDGRVTFAGPIDAIARANINIRTSERILLKCGSFRATTFDELYEGIRHIPWARIIPRDGKFWVTKATTNKSKLFSQTSIQSIAKKAMVESMSKTYHINRFTEDGEEYPVRIFIMKDVVTVGLDTTGVSLHKRGYRRLVGKAPISETLAAALIMLTPWKEDRILVDPFCGSGTFPIEAAMIGAGIAPGVNRDFTSSTWEKLIDKKLWYNAYDEARSLEKHDIDMHIQGYDLDSQMVKCAMQNAEEAGVGQYIHFQARAVKDLSSPKSYGFIITNPPYGERLEEKKALPELYRTIGERYRSLDKWSMFLITSYEDAERYIGRKADRNRKIYNGMIRSYYYQFMGAKPGKTN